MKNLILKSLLAMLTLSLIAQPATIKAWDFKHAAGLFFAAWALAGCAVYAYEWATQPSTPKQKIPKRKRVLTSIPNNQQAPTNTPATVRTQPVQQQNIILEQGNIVAQHGDQSLRGAIVNAANTDLWFTCESGRGIAGAVRTAAGTNLSTYVQQNKPQLIGVGNAITTPSFNLIDNGYKHIIHAVGPDCTNAFSDESINRKKYLCNAYTNAFNEAKNHSIQRVVLPALSVGLFNYKNYDEVAQVAIACARAALNARGTSIKQVIFVFGDSKVHMAFKNAL